MILKIRKAQKIPLIHKHFTLNNLGFKYDSNDYFKYILITSNNSYFFESESVYNYKHGLYHTQMVSNKFFKQYSIPPSEIKWYDDIKEEEFQQLVNLNRLKE